MRTTTISLDDNDYTAHYEYIKGEEANWEYPASQPTVIPWDVIDEEGNDISHTLTDVQRQSVEEQIYTNLEL